MPAREDAKDWLIANCTTCGRPFGQEEAWMDNCPVCFKETKGYKLLKGDLAFACLQYEVERLRVAKANPSPVEDGNVERLREELEELAAEAQKVAAELEKSERKRQKMRLRIQELEGEVARLVRETAIRKPPARETAPSLELPFIRKLLLLCHPDKHQNSEISTEVTQWILAQKAKHDR